MDKGKQPACMCMGLHGGKEGEEGGGPTYTRAWGEGGPAGEATCIRVLMQVDKPKVGA